MKQQDLNELLELERKFYMKLVEAMSITQELQEAVERQDEISVHMLVSSRQMPLLELQETQSFIDLKRLDLSPSDAEQFDRLVAEAEFRSPEEKPVADLVQKNKNLLRQLIALDKIISIKLCGEKSIYEKK